MAISLFTTDEQRRLYYGKLNTTIAHKLIHMSFDEFQQELLWSYFEVFVARLKLSDAPSAIRRFVGVKTLAVSTYIPENSKLLLISFIDFQAEAGRFRDHRVWPRFLRE